jgi:hypothetical protein
MGGDGKLHPHRRGAVGKLSRLGDGEAISKRWPTRWQGYGLGDFEISHAPILEIRNPSQAQATLRLRLPHDRDQSKTERHEMERRMRTVAITLQPRTTAELATMQKPGQRECNRDQMAFLRSEDSTVSASARLGLGQRSYLGYARRGHP